MRLNLINLNTEYENVPEVTSPAFMYRNRAFHRDGIFSEQIFGPVNDYQCQCGKLRGKLNEGTTCNSCGVTVTTSDKRRTTFARIRIPDLLYVVNPILAEKMDDDRPANFGLKISDLVAGKTYIRPTDKGFEVVQRDQEGAVTGPEAFKFVLYPEMLKLDVYKEFDKEYGDEVFIKNVPVIPPDARPLMHSLKDNKQYFSDEINEKYLNILRELNDIEFSPFIFSRTHVTMQLKVNSLFKTLLGKFEKKKGFLRSHVLGKRIDYSGRAVITVDGVSIPLGYCIIPLGIAKEVYKPQIIQPLSKATGLSPLEILDDYDKDYMKPHILKILKEKFIGTFVFINRQPTLHRPSFQSSKIYDITEDDVIVIHPLVTEGYNADFDGDQVALYVPHALAVKDAVQRMWVDANRRLPANGEVTYTFKQDEIMGLNKITDPNYSPKTEYLGQETTERRVEIFKKILPVSLYNNVNLFKVFNKHLNKKSIHQFIDYAEKNMAVLDWLNMLDTLCKEGFSNSFGTLSIKDFLLENPKDFDPQNAEKNSATDMIRSGARGNWDQYKQIAVEKGYISDVSGKVLPDPVVHSLIEGLTPDEFFTTCYGCRKGLIDTADNTAKSGYLTRKLVYLMFPLKLMEATDFEYDEDHTLQFYVRDEQIAKMLIRRYTTDGKITEDNYKDIVGKTINLYSPITCSSLNICPKCYGDLFESHKSHMIGLIAAQSLGERTTQLTLRTKHTSGSAEDSTQFLKPFFDMKKGVWKAQCDGSFEIEGSSVLFEIEGNEYELTDFKTFEPLIRPYGINETEFKFSNGQNIAKVEMENHDVVSAVSVLSSLLNNPCKDNEELSIQDLLYKIVDIYGSYATVDLVHFELIVSILCRSKADIYKPYRLDMKNGYTFIGLSKAISMMPEQALAFERFSHHLRKYISGGSKSLAETRGISMLKTTMFI